MLSGAMQGALSANFEGLHCRSGWRWAFIINPERPNPLAKFYMKPRHIEIALARARRVGRKPQIGITPKSFLRCFTFWQLWAFAVAWSIGGNFTGQLLQSMAQVPQEFRRSITVINNLPIIGQAIQLVAELLFSGFSDRLLSEASMPPIEAQMHPLRATSGF
ncbi:hypothetical protein LX36DRAFT_706289 [Colletotrichum falcatum]|nr:hypothetical protein LX36DRAFT_706289 [Colletotrichum falcatum]